MIREDVLAPNELCAPGLGGVNGWASDEFSTARRVAWENSRRLRWVQDWNKWIVYREGRWVRESLEESQQIVKSVCSAQIADNAGDGSRSTSFIKNVLQQSKGWLAINPDQLDDDPRLLCCKDGVLSLRQEDCGLLLDHSPDYLMSMSTGVSLRHLCDERGYVQLPQDFGGYGFYEWDNHLSYLTQMLDEDKALDFRDFFSRWCGVSLLGDQNIKPQHFLNMASQGRSGKGVAAEARVHALGDFGYVAPIRLLTRKQGDHSTEAASCQGKRLIIVEEVSMAQSAVLKDLTGGGTMSARRMRQDDITFPKSWTLELNSNQPLNLQGESTKAIRRRKIFVNLGDEVPAKYHRDGIIELLKEEADIILSWMIFGLRKWYEDGGKSAGLNIPSWMREESESQSDDDDVVGALISERYQRCDPEECKVLGSAFVKQVNERRKDSGFLPITPAAIYAYMRDNGYPVKAGSGNKTYIYGLQFAEVTMGSIFEGAGIGLSNN